MSGKGRGNMSVDSDIALHSDVFHLLAMQQWIHSTSPRYNSELLSSLSCLFFSHFQDWPNKPSGR